MIAGIGPVLAQTPTPQETARLSLPIGFLPLFDMRNPELPIEEHQGPVARAFVGGRSYFLLIDTGSSYSILKRSMVTEANLAVQEVEAAAKNADAAKLGITDGKAKIVSITPFGLGPVFMTKIPFVVASDAAMSFASGYDGSFAGVLGVNFLHEFGVYFDFEHRSIRLFKQGNTTAEERAKLGFDAKTIAVPLLISPVDKLKYLVSATCNDKSVTLLVDTGASNSVIYKPFADFGIDPSKTTDVSISEAGGTVREHSAVASIALGKYLPLKLDTRFGNAKDSDGDPELEYGDGILGSDFLSQYEILMDFPAKMMYLRPRGAR